MAGEIIDLDAHRPHVTINTMQYDNAIHVIPVSYFVEIAAGRLGKKIPPWIRAVIHEWLELKGLI